MLTIVAATLVAGSIADEAAARRRKPKSAISAMFAGTLPPSNPNADYGPVTITDGKFSVVFDQ